jgi:hypothetical protein
VQRHRFPWSCVLVAGLLAGCENSPLGQPDPSPPRPQTAPAPTPSQAAPPSPAGGAAPQPAQTVPEAEPSAPVGPPKFQSWAPPAPAADSPISLVQLSTGVALPQTGPTGTMMSFSVDYAFTRSGPDPASRYAWVIRRSKGPPLKEPVQLKDKGALQALAPGWRPDEGPFEAFLLEIRADGSQVPVSTVIALR